MKEKLLTFFKKETILCIACLLAALSAYIVPPDAAYLGYVDTRVLILLFSLMAVLAGFRALGIFDRMANLLLARAKKMRQLALTLVMLCFFSAMLVLQLPLRKLLDYIRQSKVDFRKAYQ